MKIEQTLQIGEIRVRCSSEVRELWLEWNWLLRKPPEDQLQDVLYATSCCRLLHDWKRALCYDAPFLFDFWYWSDIPGVILEVIHLKEPAMHSMRVAIEWHQEISNGDLVTLNLPEIYQAEIIYAGLEPALERLRHGLRLCCP